MLRLPMILNDAGHRHEQRQFRGFLKGAVVGLVMLLPVALLATFVL